MTLLDLLLAAIVLGSVVAGYLSGFTRAALGLIATFAGVLLGFWFYDVPAKWFRGYVEQEIVANLLGFLTVFFVAVLAGALAGRLFSAMFKAVGLRFIDRLAGAAFGLVRGALAAVAAVVILLAAAPRPAPDWMRGSVLLPYALKISDVAASLAPPAVRTAVTRSIEEIQDTWQEQVEKIRNEKRLPPPIDQ